MRKCIEEQHILWCSTCSMGRVALWYGCVYIFSLLHIFHRSPNESALRLEVHTCRRLSPVFL